MKPTKKQLAGCADIFLQYVAYLEACHDSDDERAKAIRLKLSAMFHPEAIPEGDKRASDSRLSTFEQAVIRKIAADYWAYRENVSRPATARQRQIEAQLSSYLSAVKLS